MAKKTFMLRLLSFILILVCIMAGIIIYNMSTPIYHISKAFQNTFSSLNDNELAPYWNTDTLSPFYAQEYTLALKDCSVKSFPMSSYLGGLQLSLSANTDTLTGNSYGEYTCTYSAMPITDGQFMFTKEEAMFNMPTLLKGCIDLPIVNPASTAILLQSEMQHIRKDFYHNDFKKISEDTNIQTDQTTFHCNTYQIVFNDKALDSLENILSIIDNNTLQNLLAYIMDTHSELELLTNSSLISNAQFTLSIDSKHIIRQMQCIIPVRDHTLYYTLNITGMDEPLSAYTLSFLSADTAAEEVISYCQLIKKEPASYALYAQDSSSSNMDYITFDINSENGYVHEYSVINYVCGTSSVSSMPTQNDIMTTENSTNVLNAPFCDGSVQYYLSTHPSEHRLELNIEAFSINIPDYDTSLTVSMRFSQERADSYEPVNFTSCEPVYHLDKLSMGELMQICKEISSNLFFPLPG